MKQNTLTIVVGVLLLIIFALMIFTFQVRVTEVAVVTTFDKPTDPILEPGLYWKWPRPIQKVYKFDKRIHNFEDKYEQTLTQDNYPLFSRLYVGWTISDPQAFFSSFPTGKTSEAEPALEGLIRSAKNEVIGKHPFAHFVSPDEKKLQYVEVETEILESIQPIAKSRFGVDIKFVGIEKLGLPESVTEKVFERMQAERNSRAEDLKAQGEAEAMNIQSLADRDRSELIEKAKAEATAIRAKADAEAAQYLSLMNADQDFAILLYKFRALEDLLKERTTLILDPRTVPLDLLVTPPKALITPFTTPTLGGNPKPFENQDLRK